MKQVMASQNPYPIIVYSVANCRPHLSHFWANVIVISRTELNATRREPTVKYYNNNRNHFSTANLPIFKFPAYQNFLIPKIPKICDPIPVTLLKM